MPITQDRMLSLVAAARDAIDALEKVRLYTLRQCKATREGKATAQESLDYLELMTDPMGLLRDPLNTSRTIAAEEAHFKVAAARNRANAKWNKQKRLEAGIVPKNMQNVGLPRKELTLEPEHISTAPREISPKPHRFGSIDDIIEMEQMAQIAPLKANEPKRKGPANAPNLYDPPGDDFGAILGASRRSHEELLEAIKADEERDKAKEKLDETGWKVPENK